MTGWLVLICLGTAACAGLVNTVYRNGGFRLVERRGYVLDLGSLQDTLLACVGGLIAYIILQPTDPSRAAGLGLIIGANPRSFFDAYRARAAKRSAELSDRKVTALMDIIDKIETIANDRATDQQGGELVGQQAAEAGLRVGARSRKSKERQTSG